MKLVSYQKYKTSDVEWLGEVPAHWEVHRLKRSCSQSALYGANVEYLDKATADIDSAIARARHEIALLNEYRTRLIADVVTGKLDVREAAPQLPDEADESKTFDELDDPADNAENMASGPGAISEAEA